DVEWMPMFRGLANRHQALAHGDEVDLLVVDATLLTDDDGDKKDPKDVVVVALEPRARLVVETCGLEQLLEGKVVELPAQGRAGVVRVGGEQGDPGGPRAQAHPC